VGPEVDHGERSLNREPEWWWPAILFAAGLAALCLICALARADTTLTFSVTAPCFQGLACDSAVYDSTEQGFIRSEPTELLNDLKEIRIYGRVFDEPDTIVLGKFAALPCSTYTFALVIASGKMGIIIPRAADNWGNESCAGETFLFATKALDYQPGLHAEFFDNEDLTNLVKTRIDPNIDFDWGPGSPDPAVGVDLFSARWTGYVVPPASGVYNFQGLWEDGAQLWVGSTYLGNDWGVQPEHETKLMPIQLEAGLRYPITLQYMAHNGHASCHLEWTPPGGVKEIVPAGVLSH